MTSRMEEGRGSGWASTQVTSIGDLDLAPVGERAIDKALASRNAKAAKPGAGRSFSKRLRCAIW